MQDLVLVKYFQILQVDLSGENKESHTMITEFLSVVLYNFQKYGICELNSQIFTIVKPTWKENN